METPLSFHMSSDTTTSFTNTGEDPQPSSDSCFASDTRNNVPHKRSESKAVIKADTYRSDKRNVSRQIFPHISCIPHDSIIFCFILSVWDNIVGPQTAYVWKKNKKFCSHNMLLEKSSVQKLSDEQESYIPLSDTTVSSSFNSHSSSASASQDFYANTKKEYHTNIDSAYCGLLNNTDLNARTSGSTLSYNAQQRVNDELSHATVVELNLSSVVRYVTEHSVGVGESNNLPSNRMTFHLLMAPSQNIIILSVKFSISVKGVGVPYCISSVIPSENESLMLPALNLCTGALLRLAAKVRLLITKEGLLSCNKIQDALVELCDTLSSLRDASLNQYPIENFCCKPDDRRLAERMLTSHLQTMGTTLVIADSPSEANKVVMWLAQFLMEDELSISRIALSDFQWPYQPGITIQAVIRDSSGGIDLASSKLLCSRYPVSVIDLTTNTVRQMATVNVHSKNSETALRQELLALWHDLDHVPAPSQSLFDEVEVSSSMVKRFLHEWDRLASCQLEVRQKYLKAFLRSLQYYALAIITWTRHEWTAERRHKGQKSFLHTITSTFLLEEADLKVVLAQAEILQPGFLSLVFE